MMIKILLWLGAVLLTGMNIVVWGVIIKAIWDVLKTGTHDYK